MYTYLKKKNKDFFFGNLLYIQLVNMCLYLAVMGKNKAFMFLFSDNT